MVRLCIAIIGLVASLAWPLQDSAAQTFDVAKLDLSNDGTSITLSGAIGPGTGRAFYTMMKDAPNLRMVRLDSPGGIVQEARIVYRLIQSRKLDTYVEHVCASACTLIFYAGQSRWIRTEGRLGFHRYAALKGQPTNEDQLEAAQNVDRHSYLEAGVAPWFVDKIFETPNKTIWMPSIEEVLMAKFATNVTIDDNPQGLEAHDGLPAVNHPMATAGEAPLPAVIGP